MERSATGVALIIYVDPQININDQIDCGVNDRKYLRGGLPHDLLQLLGYCEQNLNDNNMARLSLWYKSN